MVNKEELQREIDDLQKRIAELERKKWDLGMIIRIDEEFRQVTDATTIGEVRRLLKAAEEGLSSLGWFELRAPGHYVVTFPGKNGQRSVDGNIARNSQAEPAMRTSDKPRISRVHLEKFEQDLWASLRRAPMFTWLATAKEKFDAVVEDTANQTFEVVDDLAD